MEVEGELEQASEDDGMCTATELPLLYERIEQRCSSNVRKQR